MQGLQKHVGARLRALREQKGLSQEELAAACQLHRTYIGLIERGARSLSIPTVEVICRVLEVPPARLFEGVQSEPLAAESKTVKSSPTLPQLSAHIMTIRQLLVEANIVSAGRYDDLLKAHRKAPAKKGNLARDV